MREQAHMLSQVESHTRWLIWLSASFILFAVVWASYAEVDELVRCEGRVIPSKKLQIVQNLEGGIVSEILVAEGSLVDKGQVILRIDDTQFASNYQDNQLAALALEARVTRLRSELSGAANLVFSADLEQRVPKLVEEEHELFERRSAHLRSSLSISDQKYKQTEQMLATAQFNVTYAEKQKVLAQREIDILRPLLNEGLVSEVEFIQAEKTVLQAEGEAFRNQLKIPQIQAELAAVKDQKNLLITEFKSSVQEELSSALADLGRLSNTEGALKDRVSRTLIRSPVKGTVKQLMVNTIGGVVKPGMDLVSIVPIEDTLIIEAKVKPVDIARLFPSQKAMVKLTAYDSSRYGGLASEVEHISADSLVNEQGESTYLVSVRTQQNYLGEAGESLPIIPGMIAQVDIVTGKKTIMDYLLKPIYRVTSVALTER